MAPREDEGMEDDLGFVLLASGFDDSVMFADEYSDERPKATKEEEDTKISDYYGRELAQGNSYKEYETVIFTEELMTNNGFISLVNQRPTLTRSKEQLDTIKQFIEESSSLSWNSQPTVTLNHSSYSHRESSESGGRTITFGDD